MRPTILRTNPPVWPPVRTLSGRLFKTSTSTTVLQSPQEQATGDSENVIVRRGADL
jgi:hypothetical protein